MKPLPEFLHDVRQRVPGYRRFLEEQGIGPDAPVAFGDLPLQTKQNYLLKQDIADLCWDGSVRGCHIIGASSGFSKSGSVFWPKRPEDEKEYVQGLEQMFVGHYGVDKKRTLIFCCMALGTWFGGMAITAGLRVLCTEGRLPITVCTPGLNLGEAVEIYARFHKDYDQFLWITNPSSIGLIRALLKQRTLDVKPGTMFFPVVGEYYSEAFRESVAAQYGHGDEPFVVWTGYGSADAGDLGVETADTIRLRKFFHRHEGARRAFFGGDDTPMLLAPTNKKHLEIVDGRIVVTADLLVPLVRYDTGDEGGFVEKAALTTAAKAEGWSLDPALLDRLPERILYVRGRVSDQVIFYGTNLNVQDINTRFLALPPDWHYSGLFTVRPVDHGGIGIFEFTVFVDGDASAELAEKYKTALVDFLQNQSLEFRAKYTNLTQSVGTELIRVRLERLQAGQGQIKHRYVVKG